ncbi:MAG: PhnA domain-containing protein [Myxococcota bacterium]
MNALQERAGDQCELCGQLEGLAPHTVEGGHGEDLARALLVCGICRQALSAAGDLASSHWYCLQEAIWSEVPVVQVISYRLLHRLPDQPWAAELLEQVYLDEATLAWAQEGLEDREATEGNITTDCNGAVLSDGDSVTLIKDLDVKGAGFTAKRGTLVKQIRVGDDPTHIEGRVNKVSIMLKTCFLKRVS